MDFHHRILPYYMTYPGYVPARGGEDVLSDLEYLQQIYPREVRKYQQRIARILDRMDYEGSMIYDEYPDRYSLERLAGSMLQVLKNEEEQDGITADFPPEKWAWLQDLVQVLLCNEVYKRRHGQRKGRLLTDPDYKGYYNIVG